MTLNPSPHSHCRRMLAMAAPLVLLCALAAQALAQGTAAVIGGALRADNQAVWSRLVRDAGGADARWLVIPAASESPEKSAQDTLATLRQYGASGEAIPLSTRWAGQDAAGIARVARDEAWIAKVRAARGIYFTGGSQERITAALLERDGSDTPLLKEIRALLARGGVVAGSSAGAAVMSTTMIRDISDILGVLQTGIDKNIHMDRGLGFAGAAFLADQHFIKRGRIGRLLPAMHAAGYTLGVGVEEDTAIFVRGSTFEVVGSGGVVVADLAGAKVASTAPFALTDAVVHLLDRGDRFDVDARKVIPAPSRVPRRIDPHAKDFRPYYRDVPFEAAMLGDRAFVNAMTTLLDSPKREALGVAFRPSERDGQNPGIEFRLTKRPGTHGYAPSSRLGEEFTVVGMGLDLTPVLMASPLYQPLPLKKAGE
ncbi:MAG: cyanophycinase [Betaproteobacteria bacterium]|nr:cyanophycinase [Betaproteobacteria bacterium]